MDKDQPEAVFTTVFCEAGGRMPPGLTHAVDALLCAAQDLDYPMLDKTALTNRVQGAVRQYQEAQTGADPMLLRIALSHGANITLHSRLHEPPTSRGVAVRPWPSGIRRCGYKYEPWDTMRGLTREARSSGFAGFLLVDANQTIIDADAATPLWIDAMGRVYIPDPILGGVRSNTVKRLCDAAERVGSHPLNRLRLGSFGPADVFRRGGLLLAGTGLGVLRVEEVNGRAVTPSPDAFVTLQAIEETFLGLITQP